MSVAAVDRCLTVLETLAVAPSGLALGELAERLSLPKSAAFRVLHTLADRGYVDQDADRQHYRLSLKMATLGFRYLDAVSLPDLAQEALERLASRAGEYCRMAQVDGERLVWVARAQGATQGLRYDPPMGLDVVLHATATGKAWLATLPDADALRIACAQGFAPRPGQGQRAVRSPQALARELAATRERGYAIAVDEGEVGIVAIAAAFAPAGGAPAAGTVSIAGPRVRLDEARAAAIAPALLDAARELGSRWPLHRRAVHRAQPDATR
jgi:DNA-binding IclR family transcriptional regulator